MTERDFGEGISELGPAVDWVLSRCCVAAFSSYSGGELALKGAWTSTREASTARSTINSLPTVPIRPRVRATVTSVLQENEQRAVSFGLHRFPVPGTSIYIHVRPATAAAAAASDVSVKQLSGASM